MIKSKIQLAKAKKRVEKLLTQLEQLGKEYSGIELQAYTIPVRNEIKSLRREIAEYEELVSGDIQTAVTKLQEFPTPIGNIAEVLTKIRIAQDLTQKEMAKRIGWRQPNLSRFENENYSSQTILSVIEYASALGVNLEVIPKIPNFSTELVTFKEILKDKAQRYSGMTEMGLHLVNEITDSTVLTWDTSGEKKADLPQAADVVTT